MDWHFSVAVSCARLMHVATVWAAVFTLSVLLKGHLGQLDLRPSMVCLHVKRLEGVEETSSK